MPSAYTAADLTKPAGTQTGPQFAASANSNDVAQQDDIVAGQARSWSFAQVVGSGTAEQPQYMVWSNGALRVRATITWGAAGGATGNFSSITWEVSQDSGSTPNSTGTWASMGAAQTFTYDASGNLTATANAGGFGSFVSYLIGKVKALLTSFNAHTAATGTAVHGLGNMATQSAAAVAITGGAITGTAVDATRFRGNAINLGNVTGATNIDLSLGDYFYATVTGAWVPTLINLPASGKWQGMTLELTNPGQFGITGFWATVKWPSASAPSRTVAGIDIYEFWTRDGGTNVRGAQANKDNH